MGTIAHRSSLLMGVAMIGVLGGISLNITPRESLGCGGTEFSSNSGECPVAEFHMTPQVGDWDPITRKMCLQSLESAGGCTVYKYRIAPATIAPVTEDPEAGSEASVEYVDITYGSGCAENRLEGSLVEIIDEQRVVMALSGTPTRAPIPTTKSVEPLATGSCTWSHYEEAEFELFVLPPTE